MANLYVASTGSNTAPYDTWAKAATDPLTATAAAAANDTIYQHAETFTIAVDNYYTLAAGVRWICTNDKANEPPQTLSTSGMIDGSATNGVDIFVQGGPATIYGLSFKAGGVGTAGILGFANSDLDSITLDNCFFNVSGTSSSSYVMFGSSSAVRTECRVKNCSAKFGVSTQGISIGGRVWIEGGVYPDASGAVPASLFKTTVRAVGFWANGVDFSNQTSGVMFAAPGGSGISPTFFLSQCKLGAATLSAALTTAGCEFFLYDCSTSDTHYQFAHYSYLGSTTVNSTIYANDGAEYNSAGDKVSWSVAGNNNTSRGAPYVSPWFSRYNELTAAIAPEIEILRNGTTTPYTDTEVWGEWMLKTAGGSPLATLYSDYGGHLSSGTNQGAGVGLSGWTGESGTAWSGRLECPSVTPAEIGHISARVVVAGNYTVYVDPAIRGT
jgi:hypothetical protein